MQEYRVINLDWEKVLSFCSQLLLLTSLEFVFFYSTMFDVFCVKISLICVKCFDHNINLKKNKHFQITMAKKNKRDKFFFNVSHSSNEKIIAKSMTVLKLFKRSSKWDHAGCCSFIRLEMTEG